MVSIVKVAVANLSSTASNSFIKMPVGSNTRVTYPDQAWKNIFMYSFV